MLDAHNKNNDASNKVSEDNRDINQEVLKNIEDGKQEDNHEG